jgi:Ni/Co efflux regulator RcnB
VNDYSRYGLRAPPRGYQYVRSGDDVILAAVAGGLIVAVIAGLFN